MSTPRSIRLDDSVLERVMSFVLSHPGLSASSAMSLLLDEALRMHEHPGVMFRDGGAGRRPVLVSGPDIWEVVRAVRSYARELPDASRAEVLDQVSVAFDLSLPSINIALAYYGSFEAEINAWIAEVERAEQQAAAQYAAIEELLGA